MPERWKDANLIFYCNDGSKINYEKQNLEFLTTTNIYTYKLCTLKNLDLAGNNTIIYGYESGNLDFDGEKLYEDRTQKHQGEIIAGLDFVENTGIEMEVKMEPKFYKIPSHRVCNTDTDTNIETCHVVYETFSKEILLINWEEYIGELINDNIIENYLSSFWNFIQI